MLIFYYAYILLSLRDHKFYIGFTTNLNRRVREHNSGKNISTKNRRPLRLVYFEGHLSEVDARRREKYFKTAKGKSSLNQMIRNSLKPV